MSEDTALPELLAQRRLVQYEERASSQAYAYGVDLRRSRWWMQSTVGGRTARAIDRAWIRQLDQLHSRWSTHEAPNLPLALAEEIARVCKILRAGAPCVHVIHPKLSDQCPLVLPLSSANGLDQRLFVDAVRLLALPAPTRQFILGQAIAHLQCGHGQYFTGQILLREHAEGSVFLRLFAPLLRPWSRVMLFSADRAGAGCCGDIELAKAALEISDADRRAQNFWQTGVALDMRRRALDDFARSSNFERLRRLREAVHQGPKRQPQSDASNTDGDETREDPFRRLEDTENKDPSSDTSSPSAEPWSLALCDQRLTAGLRIF